MKRMFTLVLVTLSVLLGTLPALAGTTSSRGAVATSPSPGTRVRTAAKQDVQRYAQRERQAKDEVSKFRGGDVVIIGAGTAVLVLVVVLLVVLL